MHNVLNRYLPGQRESLSLIILILIYTFRVHAQNSLLTAGKLWELGRISDIQVSPDGKWVLYGVTWYQVDLNKGKRSLYLTSLETRETAMVGQSESSLYNARWRPDGKKIGFLTNKSGTMQLWEMDMKGEQSVQVTAFNMPIDNFSYSPDMKHIAFTMEVRINDNNDDFTRGLPGADALIIDDLMYRHWDSWKDDKYSHIFIAGYNDGKVSEDIKDIMEMEQFDCPVRPFGGPEDISWGPDGFSILYVCKKYSGQDYALNTNSDIYRYDILSGKTVNLTSKYKGYDLMPSYSPDGNKIAWLNMQVPRYESDQREIRVLDIKTGMDTVITKNFDQDISAYKWGMDKKSILFIASTSGTEQVFKVELGSPAYNRIPTRPENFKQLTSGDFDITGFALSGPGLVAEVMSISHPVELYTVSLTTGSLDQLTNINDPVWSVIKTGKVEKRIIKTTDNRDMLTWVIYPPDFDPQKKYPCLLYCQGGPHSQVSQFFSYRWNFQLMAANGYVVVAPNRRGLPGFGSEWNDAITRDWGGQPMRDYLSAIDSVSSESFIDRGRLGAVGASFGGYSVFFLAGIHEGRFKAFIAHDGIFNMESFFGSTEELFFADHDIGGPYWNEPRPVDYDLFSPNKYVAKWDTPMLVIHGAKDFRVPENQAMEAFTALQLRNIPSRFLYFPNENHWVLSPQNSLLWHSVFYDWLDRWLKK